VSPPPPRPYSPPFPQGCFRVPPPSKFHPTRLGNSSFLLRSNQGAAFSGSVPLPFSSGDNSFGVPTPLLVTDSPRFLGAHDPFSPKSFSTDFCRLRTSSACCFPGSGQWFLASVRFYRSVLSVGFSVPGGIRCTFLLVHFTVSGFLTRNSPSAS